MFGAAEDGVTLQAKVLSAHNTMEQSKLNLPDQTAGPVECLGETFPSDAARREHYLKLLAQKLKDPEFRKIEGFPIGKDEDILALSDPPYYTACPNPWLGEFIKRYGTPFDPKQPYHREPFATDVKENKHHPIYNAHTYHTKVPHRAIMRYILHYTEPGDLVLDAFAGTGMTGVAAQLCGDRGEVQALGYRVKDDGTILNDKGETVSKLGIRRAILNELGPSASFLSQCHNYGALCTDFKAVASASIQKIEQEFGWMFQTLHSPEEKDITAIVELIKKQASRKPDFGSSAGTINYTIWSEVFVCSECGGDVVFWDAAVDKDNGLMRDSFPCPHCDAQLTKRGLDQSFISRLDPALNEVVKQAKIVPVLINYTFRGRRYEKKPDRADLALAERCESQHIPSWFPSDRMPEGVETRRNDSGGLTHFHHFYTRRNLGIFAAAWATLPSTHKWIVTGCLHRGSKQHQVAITRVGGEKAGEGGATAGHRRGTLYVPSNQVEMNGIALMRDRADAIAKGIASMPQTDAVIVSTQSASSLKLMPESLDYFFFDPPFGANIAYSELNSTTEAWIRVFTNKTPEAIEDRAQKKSIQSYKELISACFNAVYSALKPGRWMTVEFSNTQAAIWNAIQTALQEAGFVVANVSALNKGRGGLMAIVGVTAVKQDLVISAYKPNGGLEERFAKRGETEEGAWDFIRTHLKNLPVVKAKGGQMEVIVERDPRILYDRMVAFYVRHSTPVPLSSAEFQAGLADKFPERDDMFFLPEQVNEYDKKRAQLENVGQLAIFVEDERSAINWLRSFLKDRPSTYQDIQPEFMQQLSASWKKWETRPELSALLDQSFLCYDGTGDVPSQIHSYLSSEFKNLRNLPKDHAQLKAKAKNRWFVPDPKNLIQVEQQRNKKLLEEFWTYLPDGYTPPVLTANKGQTLPGRAVPRPKIPKGKKLKELRSEAVRVGFKHCYQQKDYQTILVVAEMLPESVLNEDEQLQMLYDTAVTRSGAGE